MHDTLNNAIGEIGRLSRLLIDKQVEISNLTADNERMRAALNRIINLRMPQDLAVLADAWEIAEEALGLPVTKQTLAERYSINQQQTLPVSGAQPANHDLTGQCVDDKDRQR